MASLKSYNVSDWRKAMASSSENTFSASSQGARARERSGIPGQGSHVIAEQRL